MYSLDSSQFLGKLLTLSSVYGLLAGTGKFLNDGRVVPKIDLGSDNKAWDAYSKNISISKPIKANQRTSTYRDNGDGLQGTTFP